MSLEGVNGIFPACFSQEYKHTARFIVIILALCVKIHELFKEQNVLFKDLGCIRNLVFMGRGALFLGQ